MIRTITLALLLVPSILMAQGVDLEALRTQIAALEARIRALQATEEGFTCPVVMRSLARGARGDDVRALQVFLSREGVFAEEATGYFGALTEAAVRRWQTDHGVIMGGDTNGLGIVGPRTRAAIVDRCAEIERRDAVTVAPVTPAPTTIPAVVDSATSTSPVSSTTTCSSCIVPARTNRPPTVFGIDGPLDIEVGVVGTYIVVAEDPDGDSLEYEIDWGGGTTPLGALYALAGLESSSRSSRFTHSFPSAGLYVITASVKDPKGLSAKVSIQVRVRSVSTTCENCSTSTPLFIPETDPGDIQIPSGITSCATPWGGVILQTGRTISATSYFRGSVTYSGEAPLMRCADGRWQKCDARGANCITHRPPATNTTMQGLRRYADVVGAGGCGGLGSGATVSAEPRTLLCANVIHQAPQGRCAYTQETTAVELFCSYNNWAERLTLQ